MQVLSIPLRLAYAAFRRFLADDGWAIASHIALSALMSMFPFFLVLTALAGLLGSRELPNEAARLMLLVWPHEVADPIAREIHSVLSGAGGRVLTVGILLAVYFSSSGVESLRIGLNRAYDVTDRRPIWLLRLESIGYVLLAAVAMLALAFLVLLAPLLWRAALRHLPGIEPFSAVIVFARFGIASILLVVPLLVVHRWLPAGRRSFLDIAPGVLATLLLWLAAGTLFGRYLADFAFTYSIYYAGLASPMIALVFLYFTASIFIYGGELNTVIRDWRQSRRAFAARGPAAPAAVEADRPAIEAAVERKIVNG